MNEKMPRREFRRPRREPSLEPADTCNPSSTMEALGPYGPRGLPTLQYRDTPDYAAYALDVTRSYVQLMEMWYNDQLNSVRKEWAHARNDAHDSTERLQEAVQLLAWVVEALDNFDEIPQGSRLTRLEEIVTKIETLFASELADYDKMRDTFTACDARVSEEDSTHERVRQMSQKVDELTEKRRELKERVDYLHKLVGELTADREVPSHLRTAVEECLEPECDPMCSDRPECVASMDGECESTKLTTDDAIAAALDKIASKPSDRVSLKEYAEKNGVSWALVEKDGELRRELNLLMSAELEAKRFRNRVRQIENRASREGVDPFSAMQMDKEERGAKKSQSVPKPVVVDPPLECGGVKVADDVVAAPEEIEDPAMRTIEPPLVAPETFAAVSNDGAYSTSMQCDLQWEWSPPSPGGVTVLHPWLSLVHPEREMDRCRVIRLHVPNIAVLTSLPWRNGIMRQKLSEFFGAEIWTHLTDAFVVNKEGLEERMRTLTTAPPIGNAPYDLARIVDPDANRDLVCVLGGTSGISEACPVMYINYYDALTFITRNRPGETLALPGAFTRLVNATAQLTEFQPLDEAVVNKLFDMTTHAD